MLWISQLNTVVGKHCEGMFNVEKLIKHYSTLVHQQERTQRSGQYRSYILLLHI